MTHHRVAMLIAFVLAVLAGLGLSAAQSSSCCMGYVRVIPPSGFQPPAIVITEQTPGKVQVCDDGPSGLAHCRGVDELRDWLRQRGK